MLVSLKSLCNGEIEKKTVILDGMKLNFEQSIKHLAFEGEGRVREQVGFF